MRSAKRLKSAVAAVFLGIWAGAGGARAQETPAPDAPQYWTLGAGDKLEGPGADLTLPCTGPRVSPVCALKAYLACVVYDAPNLCAAVGLEGVVERHPGPDTLDSEVLTAPWTLPFERIMPEAFAVHIYDGGVVPATRFQTARLAPVPGQTRGAYELMADIPEPYVKGLIYTLSFFFRHDERGWRVVAWSSSRAKACDAGFGTAAWSPCKWFIKDLQLRDVFAKGVPLLWAAAKAPGRDDYPHPGIEIVSDLPNQPVVAPFAGTILRRSLKYPDMPLYDWVVIQGTGAQANLIHKAAFVDRTGPGPGAKVRAADLIGKPQWLESEHPGAGRFIHLELLRDGRQIDPRSIMRERKAQDVAK